MAGEGAGAGCGQSRGRIGVGPGCPAAPERSYKKVRCSDPVRLWWHRGVSRGELQCCGQVREMELDSPDPSSVLPQG